MRDRRAVYLRYPFKSRVVGHLCTPGSAGVVKAYVKEAHGHEPIEIRRSRYGRFDPGGMLLRYSDPPVVIPLDGWRIKIKPSQIPSSVFAIETRLKRPPTVYSGVELYRWNQMYGMLLLRKDEALEVLRVIRPMVEAEALKNDVCLTNLSMSLHVKVSGYPREVVEA